MGADSDDYSKISREDLIKNLSSLNKKNLFVSVDYGALHGNEPLNYSKITYNIRKGISLEMFIYRNSFSCYLKEGVNVSKLISLKSKNMVKFDAFSLCRIFKTYLHTLKQNLILSLLILCFPTVAISTLSVAAGQVLSHLFKLIYSEVLII